MNQAAVQFNLSERRIIHQTLAHYLGMNLLRRTKVIKLIKRRCWLPIFAYGSLLRDPHMDPDLQFPGFIPGYQRGAFFLDRYYRGSGKRNQLGVTLGIRPTGNPKDRLYGMVQGIRIRNSYDVLESVMRFAERETSLNPIYKYEVVSVQSRFGRIMALVCGTDEKSKTFIAGRLTMQEEAAIIASSFGEPGASPRNTGLAYWRFLLDCDYKAGKEPEPHIKRLVSMANAYRSKLPKDMQDFLEKLEDTPERAAFNDRVFEVDIPAYRATSDNVASILRSAQGKLNHGDPLSPQNLRDVMHDMKKIRETRHIMKKIKRPGRIIRAQRALHMH